MTSEVKADAAKRRVPVRFHSMVAAAASIDSRRRVHSRGAREEERCVEGNFYPSQRSKFFEAARRYGIGGIGGRHINVSLYQRSIRSILRAFVSMPALTIRDAAAPAGALSCSIFD